MNEKPILPLEELVKVGRCEEVDLIADNKEMREIITAIKRTMKRNNLTSLSAPGVGYNKRIFCIDYSDNEIKTYINPLISYAEGLELSREVCSSIPDKEYIRPRNSVVDIYYTTPTGQIQTKRFKGLAAMVVQHEIDHLEGITLDDIGLEVEPDFDNASDEERAEIVNMYIESLDIKRSDLQKDINEDEDVCKVYNTYRLMEALQRGDVELDNSSEEGNNE